MKKIINIEIKFINNEKVYYTLDIFYLHMYWVPI